MSKSRRKSADAYRAAGVDLDAGAALVRAIAPLAAATGRPGCPGDLGGFGGVLDLRETGLRDPLLIAASDGVGTKLAVAKAMNRHHDIGIDLVAMSVNDVVAQGGRPLLFLDYFATSRLDVDVAREVIAGIAEGCKQAGCVLLGGETAEMPGMYRRGDYDLAGFALGACEREELLPRGNIRAGDRLFGLASDGFHANGFSLLRHVLKRHGMGYGDPFPPDERRCIGEVLLRPTRIYAGSLAGAMEKTGAVKSLAHITGGGLVDNIPRALPETLSVELDAGSWDLPMEMRWFRSLGDWDDQEMARTFNCGIGMAGILDGEDRSGLFSCLRAQGETVYEIGRVVERKPGRERVAIPGGLGREA